MERLRIEMLHYVTVPMVNEQGTSMHDTVKVRFISVVTLQFRFDSIRKSSY